MFYLKSFGTCGQLFFVTPPWGPFLKPLSEWALLPWESGVGSAHEEVSGLECHPTSTRSHHIHFPSVPRCQIHIILHHQVLSCYLYKFKISQLLKDIQSLTLCHCHLFIYICIQSSNLFMWNPSYIVTGPGPVSLPHHILWVIHPSTQVFLPFLLCKPNIYLNLQIKNSNPKPINPTVKMSHSTTDLSHNPNLLEMRPHPTTRVTFKTPK